MFSYPKIVIFTTTPFYDTIAKTLTLSLQEMGLNIVRDPIVRNFDDTHLYILIGGHMWADVDPLPKNFVIYQTEQYSGRGFKLLTNKLVNDAKYIWDYSQDNIDNYPKRFWQKKAVHIPFYYHNCMEGPYSRRFVDVVFVGSPSDHRKEVIDEIEKAGIKVTCIQQSFGDNLLATLKRCKIGLNIHAFSNVSSILETSRVGPMLANKVCVISEDCTYKRDMKPLEGAILVKKNTQEIIETINDLLQNEEKLKEQMVKGYNMFKDLSLRECLEKI